MPDKKQFKKGDKCICYSVPTMVAGMATAAISAIMGGARTNVPICFPLFIL